jgi:hypothetical protein
MRFNKILQPMFLIILSGILSACAENRLLGTGASQTPYDSFKSVVNFFKSTDRGPRSRGKRSPLIHEDIYARAGKDKLIYFYQGRDRNNVRFTKTLQEYAEKAWLQVEAYTLDHHSLMEFPNSKYASIEIIAKYFGDETPGFKTPVLFLEQYDAHTVRVSVGDISFMRLVSKMNRIAEHREKIMVKKQLKRSKWNPI